MGSDLFICSFDAPRIQLCNDEGSGFFVGDICFYVVAVYVIPLCQAEEQSIADICVHCSLTLEGKFDAAVH